MPSQKKDAKRKGKMKDLQPKKLPAIRSENVKGGGHMSKSELVDKLGSEHNE